MFSSITYVFQTLLRAMDLRPQDDKTFEFYEPDNKCSHRITLPVSQLKAYLQDLDPNLKVAFIHTKGASGPFVESIESILNYIPARYPGPIYVSADLSIKLENFADYVSTEAISTCTQAPTHA
jgi:hypothetical protein